MNRYLETSAYIDFDAPGVAGKAFELARGAGSEEELVRRCFLFVRDEIRHSWDYKTNPIRFSQEGQARLLIVTCYPPGKKQAAWITHFKMVSSSNL